jgi:gamma-glutamyltranspeptidase/glutathione hydrolase
MAATSHPLSTLAAIEVLKSGGNAMDAAVAGCAVQCVVEPQSTGIGGDCFVLYAPGGEDNVLAYNGSGRAPARATAEWFQQQGIRKIDSHTPHAVTVPGAIDAWTRLITDHGSRDIRELLQPAIRLANEGYPVHPRVAFDWALAEATIQNDPETTRIFMPDGRPISVGAMHRQPALGSTLARIAEKGRDGFYEGPVAEDVVARLNALGGLHTLEDFASAQGEYVTPIRTPFRGYDVLECPPNGQGIIALLILNIVSELGKPETDPLSVARLHLMVEATRLAYRDRNAFVADPTLANVPVEWLLSKAHAGELRRSIRAEQALENVPATLMPAHEDTIYLCVVDKDRNAVSFINSLFQSFGSGIMAPCSGVVLQNRGSGFVIDPDHPNCIGPGKRPMHTIIPGMVVKDGRAVMPFGVMGGQYQAMGHAWFLTNLLDFGLDVQEAIDLPRLFPTSEGLLEVESSLSPATIEALKRLGHRPTPPPKPIGGGQAIRIDWSTGVLCGGSDPRKDGCALGY